MIKRYFVILFLLFGISFSTFMIVEQTQKLNLQLKLNKDLEDTIKQSYSNLKETNATFIEKKLILLGKIQHKNELNEAENNLLNLQNKLNQDVYSYSIYESKDPREFVDVNNSSVLKVLEQITKSNMGSNEKAKTIFNYARDEIVKEDKLTRNGRIDYWNYSKNTIDNKKGSYEDKIVLLASLLRSVGFNENDVEIVGAKVNMSESTFSDMWVELKLGGSTYLLLPRENNNFDSFNKNDIYKLYRIQELFRFNDKIILRY